MRVVGLQPRPQNLVRIRDASGEYLGETGYNKEVGIPQRPRPAVRIFVRVRRGRLGPVQLQFLVRHELKRPVADAEERWYKTPVEARQALRAEDLLGAGDH